ncbi:hypothetical protein KI387_012447, partial [Taxus chinensis]
ECDHMRMTVGQMRKFKFDWFEDGIEDDGTEMYDPEYQFVKASPLPQVSWSIHESGDINGRTEAVIRRSKEWFKKKKVALIKSGGFPTLKRKASHLSSSKATKKTSSSTHSRELSKRKLMESEAPHYKRLTK